MTNIDNIIEIGPNVFIDLEATIWDFHEIAKEANRDTLPYSLIGALKHFGFDPEYLMENYSQEGLLNLWANINTSKHINHLDKN